MRYASPLLLVGALLAIPASPASAQVDFSGSWVLDRAISGDLAKATFDPPAAPAHRANPRGFSAGMGRAGFGHRGGSGGRPPGGAGGNDAANSRGTAPLTVEEHARLRELADYVKRLASIVIEHSDHSTFTVTDSQGRSQLFPTDGTKVAQALTTTSVDSATNWDGPHIVTIYTIGPSRDLVFTYILVPATKQMALRVRLDEAGHARADVPELRLVYKRSSDTSATKGPRP